MQYVEEPILQATSKHKQSAFMYVYIPATLTNILNTHIWIYILLYNWFVFIIFIFRCTENKSLPFRLRAAFSHIMQCVHLDINPQETVNPVGYSRLWGQIPDSTTTVSEYSPWLDT